MIELYKQHEQELVNLKSCEQDKWIFGVFCDSFQNKNLTSKDRQRIRFYYTTGICINDLGDTRDIGVLIMEHEIDSKSPFYIIYIYEASGDLFCFGDKLEASINSSYGSSVNVSKKKEGIKTIESLTRGIPSSLRIQDDVLSGDIKEYQIIRFLVTSKGYKNNSGGDKFAFEINQKPL